MSLRASTRYGSARHERDAVALERDHVSDREDHRAVADPELLARRGPVVIHEAFGIDSDDDVGETVGREVIARLHVGVDEVVDQHHVRVIDRHERAHGELVSQPEDCAQRPVAVHERGVDREHGRHLAAARPDRAHPREIEELPVLMQHVGTEVVEDAKEPAQVARPERHGDVVVERQAGPGRRPARQPHNAVSVTDLVGGRVLVRGGDDQHLVAALGEMLREALGEVDAPARSRHEEVVDHRDAHEVTNSFPVRASPPPTPSRRRSSRRVGGRSRVHSACRRCT